MNINQYTTPQPFWRNSTSVDSNDPTNPNKATISNSTIVDSGANQAWSLEIFFEIALPLMVGTTLVPLIIGAIIRSILQALSRGRSWWRLLLAVVVIWFVAHTLSRANSLLISH